MVVTLCALSMQLHGAEKHQATQHDHHSVVHYLMSLVDAKLALAQAKFGQNQQRLQSISSLHDAGHASFLELTSAQLENATLSANLKSARQLRAFVHAGTINASASPGDHSASTTTIINILSLGEHPVTQAIAHVQIPGSIDINDAAETQNAGLNNLGKPFRTRAQAWRELMGHLSKIDDRSPSMRQELAITLLKQQVAEAETTLAQAAAPTIQQFRSTADFLANGKRVEVAIDVIKSFDSEATRLHQVAVATANAEKLVLLNELERRIATAAADNAAPTTELPAIQQTIAMTRHAHQTATQTLQSIASRQMPQPTMTDGNTTLVGTTTYANLTAAQCALIQDLTLSRVLDASEAASAAMRRHDYLASKLRKVTRIAQEDSFFDSEVARLHLEHAVAETKVHQADFDHERLVLEHEYATARVDGELASNWLQPLTELFKLRATSRATEEYLVRNIELQQWRVDGLTELYQEGAATWKELTAAIVQRDELQYSLARAEIDRVTAGLVFKMLSDWHSLSSTRDLAHSH